MRQSYSFGLLGAAFLLISIVAALPDDNPDMSMHISKPAEDKPQNYFALGEHSGSILAHIILEVISWCFILPIGKLRISYLRPFRS